MRKKLFAALIVAAGIAFAGYNVAQSQNEKNSLSDLLTANVEALAGGETLPDVEITCGKTGGKCWQFDGYCYKGEHTYNKCTFDGSQSSSCSSNC